MSCDHRHTSCVSSSADLPAAAHTVKAYLLADNLRRNVATFRRVAGNVAICAVVKADAYGHGVGLVADVLADRVDAFAVYGIEEAEKLRSAARGKPILSFRPVFAGADPELIRLAAARGFQCTICSLGALEYLAQVLHRRSDTLDLHLKLDTGMGRAGCHVAQAGELLAAIRHCEKVRLTGVYTHFAAADEHDLTFTAEQLESFTSFISETGLADDAAVIKHTCNSAAALRLPPAHFDMIRPGIGLYGYMCEELHGAFGLLPTMRVEAPLIQVKAISPGSSCGYGRTYTADRAMVVGIIPLGYEDALPRCLSNRASLRIGPHKVPIIGRISMDQTILDLSVVPDPHEGMLVTVIDDDPDSFCNAQALSSIAQTIPYEILTGIGARVKRIRIA